LEDNGKFKANLKLPQIVALYIGSVLGSGILIIPGIAAEVAGPASLLAWGIMAVLVMPMALTMALLSAKYPDAGGVAHFVAEAFNPKTGSLFGWFFVMAVVVGAPVLALTGAGYLSNALGLSDAWRLVIAAIILLAGLLSNYYGMKLTGQIQIAVVLTILAVLTATIAGSIGKIEYANLKPFVPNGPASVGTALTILFWCFIGWEAVSNMSSEFENPRRDAVLGTILAAVTISIVYFLTAFVIVGTHSYGASMSDVSLIYVIKRTFGLPGAVIAGFAALFVCVSPAIAYIGAIARLVYSLSTNGYAPKKLSYLSRKHNTPAGGLIFLAVCFSLLLAVFSVRIISLSTLIQLPNAAFILTYIGGCAAGIKLLKGSRFGVFVSIVSLIFSLAVFVFVKWTILYPAIIALAWFCYSSNAEKTD
jgi:amino acid efflux transporter